MTESAVTVVSLPGDRTRIVPLEYPAELADGTIIREVVVRRMTSAEVEAFTAAAAGGQEVRLPMFDQPSEILDSLDSDDSDALNRVAIEMLPRRLRRVLETAQPVPPVEPAAVSDPPPAADPA